MASLRERNRINAKRSVQRSALAMFKQRGFDEVTVEEIAREAEMAASTVYRHFSTKEAIVLWDEHEGAIDAALGSKLGSVPPLQAMREAFVEALGGRYDGDLEFQLERIKFIYATEQIHAAAVEADFRDRAELAVALRKALSRKHQDSASLLAGAALLAVDVAIEQWQASGAKRPLTRYLNKSFDAIESLASLT